MQDGGENFLLLHPLMVFWEREAGQNAIVQTDTAISLKFSGKSEIVQVNWGA
jgi:hypothetical protein